MVPVPALPPSTTTASIVIKWNTHAAAARPQVRYATVTSVSGTRVTVRLADGTLQNYIASAQEAAALRGLIGKTIAFRAR